jgi:hypothetical protein
MSTTLSLLDLTHCKFEYKTGEQATEFCPDYEEALNAQG